MQLAFEDYKVQDILACIERNYRYNKLSKLSISTFCGCVLLLFKSKILHVRTIRNM